MAPLTTFYISISLIRISYSKTMACFTGEEEFISQKYPNCKIFKDPFFPPCLRNFQPLFIPHFGEKKLQKWLNIRFCNIEKRVGTRYQIIRSYDQIYIWFCSSLIEVEAHQKLTKKLCFVALRLRTTKINERKPVGGDFEITTTRT